jgi:hypothetical protein
VTIFCRAMCQTYPAFGRSQWWRWDSTSLIGRMQNVYRWSKISELCAKNWSSVVLKRTNSVYSQLMLYTSMYFTHAIILLGHNNIVVIVSTWSLYWQQLMAHLHCSEIPLAQILTEFWAMWMTNLSGLISWNSASQKSQLSITANSEIPSCVNAPLVFFKLMGLSHIVLKELLIMFLCLCDSHDFCDVYYSTQIYLL